MCSPRRRSALASGKGGKGVRQPDPWRSGYNQVISSNSRARAIASCTESACPSAQAAAK